MKTLKVFSLIQHGRDGQEQNTLEVIGVYSTRTKAKEKLQEKQNEIRGFYEDNYPEEFTEYHEGYWCCWGCSCDNEPIFDELLIVENEIDKD